MPLFLGEASGARVFEVGLGVTDATAAGTADVLFDCTTHDQFPGGPGASVEFRGIVVTLRHDSGYQIGVTPIVDGMALTEQLFQSPAPPATADGTVTVKAPFAQRGVRCAARVRQTAATGLIELVDIAAVWYLIRQAP